MTNIRIIVSGGCATTSVAERLIDLARIANQMLRRGTSLDDVSALLGCSVEACRLALMFFQAGDGYKLRAIVENWSLGAIARHCDCQARMGHEHTTNS